MAVRRSARLHSSQESREVHESTPQPDTTSRLASVAEHDETTAENQPQVQTPLTKTASQKTPNASDKQGPAGARTPTSVIAARPTLEEMHPSKVHQSTTKQVDSGLILGFNPVKRDANGNIMKNGAVDNTPTKFREFAAPSQFGSPGFDFKFSSQESQLSDEAKRLMNNVREDVARIKAQMVHDKSEQEKEDREAEQQVHGDRKIAKPKGKAGRFSDVHMAEFRKMDSIAGHASSFRATPGRFQPVTKSLKRTKSKAQLDEPETQDQTPSRSAAKPLAACTPSAIAKRVKHSQTDDSSMNRPSAEKNHTVQKPAGPRNRPPVHRSLMTPTRASKARSISVKAPKTSLIPSLAQSPAARTAASPRTPRTDFNPRLKSNLPPLGSLKSILRRHQPLFSRDPAKIAAGTHMAAPDFNPDSLFGGIPDLTESTRTPSPKKHVDFSPSVKSRHEPTQASPSPSKIPTAPSRSTSDVVYPTLPTLTPEKNSTVTSSAHPAKSPTIRQVRQSDACERAVSYPELPVVAHGIAHGIGNKKRHRAEVDDDVPDTENAENVPPSDAQSEERSTKRLKANPPTPSPVKFYPAKTPTRSTPGRMGTPTSARQKARSVLSLSRLNMLAKPKGRT